MTRHLWNTEAVLLLVRDPRGFRWLESATSCFKRDSILFNYINLNVAYTKHAYLYFDERYHFKRLPISFHGHKYLFLWLLALGFKNFPFFPSVLSHPILSLSRCCSCVQYQAYTSHWGAVDLYLLWSVCVKRSDMRGSHTLLSDVNTARLAQLGLRGRETMAARKSLVLHSVSNSLCHCQELHVCVCVYETEGKRALYACVSVISIPGWSASPCSLWFRTVLTARCV